MDGKFIDRILSVDIKALTNENKEVIVRYTDFKDLDNATISYNYTDHYTNNFCYRQKLVGISFDINCKGYALEVVEEE